MLILNLKMTVGRSKRRSLLTLNLFLLIENTRTHAPNNKQHYNKYNITVIAITALVVN